MFLFSWSFIKKNDHFLSIHREAPAFVEQATEQHILVTRIKVIISYNLLIVFICIITILVPKKMYGHMSWFLLCHVKEGEK